MNQVRRMQARRRVGYASVLALAVAMVGCGGGGGDQAQDTAMDQEDAQVATPTCAPVGEMALPREATADGFAGTYRLVLVSPGEQERRAEGTLSLMRQADSLRSVPGIGGAPDPVASMPVYGTADIELEAVGGLRLGDLSSTDPTMPGVGAYQRPGDITLRLGSETNRRGVVRFDGGFMALQVREVTDQGFRGTWASGVTGRDATGYFCATRT